MEVFGPDFDVLEATDVEAARAVGLATPDLVEYRLTGRMTCTVTVSGTRSPAALDFTFDFGASRGLLSLALDVDGIVHVAQGESFDECLRRIEAALPPEVRLTSCLTCRWSRHELFTYNVLGMHCCRDAKEQALAARGKGVLQQVPVAEFVPETHLCAEYERDVPAP